MKVAESAYAEYQKHTPEATDWNKLSIDQQEGFAAATYHGLVAFNAIATKNSFVLRA